MNPWTLGKKPVAEWRERIAAEAKQAAYERVERSGGRTAGKTGKPDKIGKIIDGKIIKGKKLVAE